MDKIKKILNLRFSYFLLSGLAGFFLITGGYLSFSSLQVTPTNIMSGKYVNLTSYIAPLYFMIFGSLLVGLMGLGYFLCAGKDNAEVKGGAVALMASSGGNLLLSLVHMIICYATRKNLMSNKNMNITYTFNSIRLVIIIACFASVGFISYGLLKHKKMDILGKTGAYIGIGCTGVFLFFSILFFICSFFTACIPDLMYFYVSSEVYPYSNCVYNMNFFSLTQLSELKIQIDEIAEMKSASVFPFILSYIYQIIYLTALGGSIVFTGVHCIESFDIKYDNDRMSL